MNLVDACRHALLACAAAAIATPAVAQTAARPPAFATCAVCHKTVKGETSTMGPNLWQIGGRAAGSQKFAYSPAMKSSKIKWNRKNLTQFVMTPRSVVPGTRMAYAGQKDPKIAEAIADYLLTLK